MKYLKLFSLSFLFTQVVFYILYFLHIISADSLIGFILIGVGLGLPLAGFYTFMIWDLDDFSIEVRKGW